MDRLLQEFTSEFQHSSVQIIQVYWMLDGEVVQVGDSAGGLGGHKGHCDSQELARRQTSSLMCVAKKEFTSRVRRFEESPVSCSFERVQIKQFGALRIRPPIVVDLVPLLVHKRLH